MKRVYQLVSDGTTYHLQLATNWNSETTPSYSELDSLQWETRYTFKSLNAAWETIMASNADPAHVVIFW